MDGGRNNGLSRQSSALWRSFRNGDFEEGDVWDVLKEKSTKTSDDDLKLFSDSSRMIPRPIDGGNAQIAPKSAPKSIPRWFNRRNPRNFDSAHDDSSEDNDDDGVADDDEDKEGFDERVPPHELIAKRMARAQISSFSVVEGVGRTLKGRDLSKVRNAVLNKTGFLESL